jgi:CHAT domain
VEYLDFELRVGPGTGTEYPVEVLRSPSGEASGTMRFPFDTLALQNHLQALEIAVLRSGTTRRDIVSGDEREQPVTEFGRRLFDALVADAVRETFRRSQDRARAAGKGLRLRLRIEDPALAALPWEYLYDPSEGEYVCLQSDTPLVRYLELEQPAEPLVIQPPLSVLGVVASPSDRPPLDVQREIQRVEAATASLRDTGLLRLTWLETPTWRSLQRAMRHGPYHVFHFVGHGGFDATQGEGVVAFADDDGTSALLTATQLGRLLADHRPLRLAVLNSCLGARGSGRDVFSSTASILVRRGVPAVIAMQYEISDRAAIEFARSLYEAVADGTPVDAAVAEARKAISFASAGSVEWGTPVLHMRSSDGVLFAVDRTGMRAVPKASAPNASTPNVSLPNASTPYVSAPSSAVPNAVPNAVPSAAASSAAASSVTRSAESGGATGGEPAVVVPPVVAPPAYTPPAPPPAPLPPHDGPAAEPIPPVAARSRPARGCSAKLITAAGTLSVVVTAAIVLMTRASSPNAPESGSVAPSEDTTAASGTPDSAPVTQPPASADTAGESSAPAAAPDTTAEETPGAPGAPLVAIDATRNGDAVPFGEAGMRVERVWFVREGNGFWELHAMVSHARGAADEQATVRCVLRPGGPEERVVPLVVEATRGTPRAEFQARWRVRHQWPPGEYQIACTSEDGTVVYDGTLTAR